MSNEQLVRILRLEISNFKNVEHGIITFMNDASLRRKLEFSTGDVVGLYGPNGSGKSAAVEVLDIIKHIICGKKIPYDKYSELISDADRTELSISFFTEYKRNDRILVKYTVQLIVNEQQETIALINEKLSFQPYSGKNWLRERSMELYNPYAVSDALLTNERPEFKISSAELKTIDLIADADRISLVCAQQGVSVFFNTLMQKKTAELMNHSDSTDVVSYCQIVQALNFFGLLKFEVVKVDQLGLINVTTFLPLLLHRETANSTGSGVVPISTDKDNTILKEMLPVLEASIKAINVALKGIVPDLSLEIEVKNEIVNEDKEFVQVAIDALRGEKRFSIKHESDGIKRIISLMAFLTTLYSDLSVCLVVDELDDGIFEFLLGEMLGTLGEEAKGQLIFTSHNLRALEKLPSKNIIYTTVNPANRYIRLKGISGNNNRRDFYIRALRLGGQDEELYHIDDLEDFGNALRSANSIINNKTDDTEVNKKFADALASRLDELQKKNNPDLEMKCRRKK